MWQYPVENGNRVTYKPVDSSSGTFLSSFQRLWGFSSYILTTPGGPWIISPLWPSLTSIPFTSSVLSKTWLPRYRSNKAVDRFWNIRSLRFGSLLRQCSRPWISKVPQVPSCVVNKLITLTRPSREFMDFY